MSVKMKGNLAHMKGLITLIDRKMTRMIEQRRNIAKIVKKLERKAVQDAQQRTEGTDNQDVE